MCWILINYFSSKLDMRENRRKKQKIREKLYERVFIFSSIEFSPSSSDATTLCRRIFQCFYIFQLKNDMEKWKCHYNGNQIKFHGKKGISSETSFNSFQHNHSQPSGWFAIFRKCMFWWLLFNLEKNADLISGSLELLVSRLIGTGKKS